MPIPRLTRLCSLKRYIWSGGILDQNSNVVINKEKGCQCLHDGAENSRMVKRSKTYGERVEQVRYAHNRSALGEQGSTRSIKRGLIQVGEIG
jgi:hypothetical protein